ncbi:unnamed protein product [Rotaria socialis]|uniref:P-type ATPase N-terminal domain-containing protein n=1 Tax=Rotaria socialis TaxID=392032 RepID=A0A818EMD6_9BILA|nr:unnamed protein product [Rotaria socialis]CAF3375849.1 unnamed protein product [Rotaria socialis]CAF3461206.1 unnamed protein product [Rotaria socialis]
MTKLQFFTKKKVEEDSKKKSFRRLANAYFICLQLIPQISSLAPITTILPLVFVLALTAIKDATDDIVRHRSDRHVNNREIKTVVGDIVQLTNSDLTAIYCFDIN